ncbi:helix-turn-helix domain-containing protein [Chitinophaga pendula]|uniref:helix-turn-helix domain-containing protein n=1 Tax=Chitinophaga TaxID=79328 RepID=UPI0012FDDA5F|nr:MULTISPECIES: helix-turn-helix domain-containing protein [Chitinophaga]UCJ06832.1 helix-turn-helix domain-containing protein [Chitinophaga pendula]
MYIDFEQSGIAATYSFPWSSQIRVNFMLNGSPLKILKEGSGQVVTLPACSVVGPQMGRNMVYYDRVCVMAIVCFHPGAFHRLTGIPVHEIINQDLDAGHVLGRGIWQVQRELQAATSPAQMKQVIEQFFLKRIAQADKKILPFDQAISRWVANKGLLSVSQVATDACLSNKQFERKCYERLGLTPKLFARLLRFSKAHAMVEQQTGQTWAAIAYECGYYDQMHFIRDFKAFAGTTPTIMDGQLEQSLKLIELLETDPELRSYHELTGEMYDGQVYKM